MTHSAGNMETVEILKKATQKDVHIIGLERSDRNVTHLEEADVKVADQKVSKLENVNLTQSETEESKLRKESTPLEADTKEEEETSNEF